MAFLDNTLETCFSHLLKASLGENIPTRLLLALHAAQATEVRQRCLAVPVVFLCFSGVSGVSAIGAAADDMVSSAMLRCLKRGVLNSDEEQVAHYGCKSKNCSSEKCHGLMNLLASGEGL